MSELDPRAIKAVNAFKKTIEKSGMTVTLTHTDRQGKTTSVVVNPKPVSASEHVAAIREQLKKSEGNK